MVQAAKDYDKEYRMAVFGEDSMKIKKLSASGKTVLDWCKDLNFYLHGVVYIVVRLGMVVTVSIQPFYLGIVTGFEKTPKRPTPPELALVPLMSYITSLIFTLFF